MSGKKEKNNRNIPPRKQWTIRNRIYFKTNRFVRFKLFDRYKFHYSILLFRCVFIFNDICCKILLDPEFAFRQKNLNFFCALTLKMEEYTVSDILIDYADIKKKTLFQTFASEKEN